MGTLRNLAAQLAWDDDDIEPDRSPVQRESKSFPPPNLSAAPNENPLPAGLLERKLDEHKDPECDPAPADPFRDDVELCLPDTADDSNLSPVVFRPLPVQRPPSPHSPDSGPRPWFDVPGATGLGLGGARRSASSGSSSIGEQKVDGGINMLMLSQA